MFAELCDQMYQYFTARRRALKNRDLEREKNPDWFRQKDMLGMMLYIDNLPATSREFLPSFHILRNAT